MLKLENIFYIGIIVLAFLRRQQISNSAFSHFGGEGGGFAEGGVGVDCEGEVGGVTAHFDGEGGFGD